MVNKMAMKAFGRVPTAEAEPTNIENAPTQEDSPANPEMVGNYSRIKVGMMDNELARAKQELSVAKGDAIAGREIRRAQIEGVLNGTIPVRLDSDCIYDAIESDRIASPEDSDDDPSSHLALKENIKRRGQRTPIRVRPLNASWRPSLDAPFDMSGVKFALQSGRRRLRACRELGRPVYAFLSFPDEGLTKIDDLQERYFENVARRDLTTAEKLYSIGMISASMDLKQSEVAELLHIDRSTVSRANFLYENFDALKKIVDLKTATSRDIERAISQLKSPHPDKGTIPLQIDAPAPLPYKHKVVGGHTLRMRRDAKGRQQLTITVDHLDQQTLDALEKVLGDAMA